MSMLRNGLVLSSGVIACAVAWGAPPPVMATLKNTQPTAAAAVGGQPPVLVTGKPRFPIIPAGVPIKATPITRTTNNKGLPQQASNHANSVGQQAANAQAPAQANSQAIGKQASKTPVANGTAANNQPTAVPASPVVAPGNAPAAPAASANTPAAPATPSPGNGASNAGNAGGGTGGNAGSGAAPAPAAPSGS